IIEKAYGSGIVVFWSLLTTTAVPFVPTAAGTTSAPGVVSPVAGVVTTVTTAFIGGFSVVFLCGVASSLRSCLGCCFSGFLRLDFGVGCFEFGYCVKVLGKQIADFLVRRLHRYHWCDTCCCRSVCSKCCSGSGHGVFFTLSSRRMVSDECSHDCGNACRWYTLYRLDGRTGGVGELIKHSLFGGNAFGDCVGVCECLRSVSVNLIGAQLFCRSAVRNTTGTSHIERGLCKLGVSCLRSSISLGFLHSKRSLEPIERSLFNKSS